MCGIVGMIGQRDVVSTLLQGLARLEYRGYDSAGLVVICAEEVVRRRVKGKIKDLAALVNEQPLQGSVGMAHTRWATHGQPSEINAHPHISHQRIAVVHNGIIENHETLRQSLAALGYQFESETDTELFAHYIHYFVQQGLGLIAAVQAVVAKISGASAFGVLDRENPEHLVIARRGCPVVIGLGQSENFFASDPLALLAVTKQFIYLEEGDIADIKADGITIFDCEQRPVKRTIHHLNEPDTSAEKGHYRHFMLKEIEEQPQAIRHTLEVGLRDESIALTAFGEAAPTIFPQIAAIQIVACGTSYHAGLVAKHWIEEYLRLPCQVEVASEWRYRSVVVLPNTLFIAISQSGETADTLAALRQAKHLNYLATLAVCNVAQSALVREADLAFLTRAGFEVGVASTKAFTTQLVGLLLMVLALQKQKSERVHLIQQLTSMAELAERVLTLSQSIQEVAHAFADKTNALFLGRGIHYPIALEGALKLKELSYIHAEAYPAGELKHGPLALIDKRMPVIALLPKDEMLEKLMSNLHEVTARGGELYLFIDESVDLPQNKAVSCIRLPQVPAILSPIVYTIPLQLLAYHVAVLKGTDVDQPRNLAKSVTVE